MGPTSNQRPCALALLGAVHSYGTRRVHANVVYQEYISDKQHLHMNATKWSTLTEFVKHLGREGLAEVTETEKGWFIQYIDRDPEVLARQVRVGTADRTGSILGDSVLMPPFFI